MVTSKKAFFGSVTLMYMTASTSQDLCAEVQLHHLVDQRADDVQTLVQDPDELPEPHVDGLFVGLDDLDTARDDHDRRDYHDYY